MDKEKPAVPGAEYEKVVKKSRRKKGTTTKDEPTGAGPSSNVPQPSPAQSGYGPDPSVQKSASVYLSPYQSPKVSAHRNRTSTGTTQTSAPTGARQSVQTPKQPAQASSSSTRPTQSSAPTGPRQASQSSTQPSQAALSVKPTQTPRPQAPASQDRNKGGSFAQLAVAQINRNAEVTHHGQASRDDAEKASSTGALPASGTASSEEKHLTSGLINKEETSKEGQKIIHAERPRRAGYGERGVKAELFANYFRLNIDAGLVLHRYSIRVQPELKGKRLTQIVNNALCLTRFDALRPGIATDFSGLLVSRRKFSQNDLNVSVPMAAGLNADELREAKKYAVWFDFVSTSDFSQLQSTEKPNLADQESLPVVQDLDIILGHYRKSSPNVAAVGKRKAFSMNPPAVNAELGGVLKALQGFFSSVRFCQNGPLVNINVSNSPFWKQSSLVNVVRSLQSDSEINNTKIPALLRGLQVQLTYIQDNSVTRTVSGYACHGDGNGYMSHPPRVPRDVLGPGPQAVLFFREKNPRNDTNEEERNRGNVKPHSPGCSCDGDWVSVAKYFAEKYQIQCNNNDNQLPVVNIGNSNHPAYVPLKVCLVLEQASKMKLNARETNSMQRFAVRTPNINANDILNGGFRTLGLLPGNQKLLDFGLHVEQKLITVQGRALSIPKLTYRGNISQPVRQRSKWDLRGVKFMEGKRLESWSCLNIHSRNQPPEDPTSYVRNFVKELNNRGITCTPPEINKMQFESINIAAEAKSVLGEWFRTVEKRGIRFLLIILPWKTPDLYNHIKRLGDQDFGILTCCVVGAGDKFYNNKDPDAAVQYNANVALKVNLKLGGVNHVLGQGQLYKIKELENKTMVIGIDVTHPSVGSSENAPSIAAMVASDKQLAQWPADLRINKSREEMIGKLRPMLESRLKWWKDKYDDLPQNLLIYRDGVSEGQYQAVLDEELPQIREACIATYKGDLVPYQNPKISLIVVGKRHHTRFIRKTKDGGPIDSSDRGRASNPEPGTVVDNTITYRLHNWDFFLQSHKPIFGTARPAHYFVLVDEIFRQWPTKEMIPKPFSNPAEILEQVTQNLCFLFGRATTSVSIPPPVYYADIACERGRRYLSRFYDPRARKLDTSRITDKDVEVHWRLTDKMFYI